MNGNILLYFHEMYLGVFCGMHTNTGNENSIQANLTFINYALD